MLACLGTVELLSMEPLERAIPQAVPEIEIDSNADLFYKCPVGGFASLNPGICPKCNERLVAVYDARCTADESLYRQRPQPQPAKFEAIKLG